MTMTLNPHPISTALPVELSDLLTHLRISDDTSDEELIRIGFTAATGVEQFARIALLTQTIAVTAFDPTSVPGLPLPIGPMATELVPAVLIDGSDFTDFDLVRGARAYLRWGAPYHGLNPRRVEVNTWRASVRRRPTFRPI